MHVMTSCRGFTGHPEKLYHADYYRACPRPGYDSVEAATTAEGEVVTYPLTAVYNENYIIYVGLIVYTRVVRQPR